jgi:hypothetical protein
MKKRQDGAALVEFALVLPLLLVLTFVTTEIGRALYQYNTLAKSVRDAARYLSLKKPGNTVAATQAKNLVVYGDLSNTGLPLAIGLATTQVNDPTWQLGGEAPVINTVTIKIAGCATSPPPCYQFSPLVASVFGLSFANIKYGDISATMRAPL